MHLGGFSHLYMFQAQISNKELEDLPVKVFNGDIIIVDKEEEVKPAVEYLSKSTLLGFDTETRPSFVKGKRHKVALLQLSNEERAYLFRLKYTGIPNELVHLLEDGGIIKIGAAIREDLRVMQRLKPFLPMGFIDLQAIVKKYGIMEMSVRKLAAIVLGVKISKSQQLSNWENEKLTDAQQRYAATDAWVCREIYQVLQKTV